MIFGLSHLDLPVRSLSSSEAFYGRVLGAKPKKRGDGFLDLEAGSVSLRLIEVKAVERTSALRLQAGDVPAAVELVCAAGGTVLYAPTRTAALELEACCTDPDGHRLTLWRELSEDEYGFVPELPTEGAWDPAAEALLKGLLLHVPTLFRGLARQKIVRNAEHLTAGRRVLREDVVRAYILSSAKVTRYRLRAPLVAHGIDPGQYAEEFDA